MPIQRLRSKIIKVTAFLESESSSVVEPAKLAIIRTLLSAVSSL